MLVLKMKSPPWNAPELRGSIGGMRYPAFAEIKLDGEFNFIEYKDKGNGLKICTVNKYGTIRLGFPELTKMGYVLQGNGVKQAVMLCELYWNEGKLGALYELLCHKKDDNVKIHVFDVLMRDGQDLRNLPLVQRKEHMWEMVGQWQLGDKIVNNKIEAHDCFMNATAQGYEGVVIKSLDSPLILGPCSWVKMKYKDQNELPVVTIDPNKERIEVKHNGTIVGVKAPNRYKRHINVNDIVTIEHQGVLDSGSLRHPVLIAKKEWK